MTLTKMILQRYFKAHRKLVVAKQLDERSIMVSFPLHYSGFTRVELAVTQLTPNEFVISDIAQTIGELRDSGYAVSPNVRSRILELIKICKMKLSGDNLLLTCTETELGDAIHEFVETIKTIGDVYLAYPVGSSLKDTQEEESVKQQIRKTLDSKRLHYKENKPIVGALAEHKVDFFVPPNGIPGLAVAVLPSPDKVHAESWGFKTQDIKKAARRNGDERVFVSIVYDPSLIKEVSRKIIDAMADIPIASTELESFGQRIDAKLGLSNRKPRR